MLFIAGDNHGHFDHLIQAAKKHRPSAVISVGDITETAAGEAPNVPVHVEIAELLDMGIDWWWIPGNHDTDSAGQYDALFASCPDTNLDGRVVTLSDPDLGDVRVAGLGGSSGDKSGDRRRRRITRVPRTSSGAWARAIAGAKACRSGTAARFSPISTRS